MRYVRIDTPSLLTLVHHNTAAHLTQFSYANFLNKKYFFIKRVTSSITTSPSKDINMQPLTLLSVLFLYLLIELS